MGFRSGVEATFVARVRLPPGAINRAATPLRKCVGERGYYPATIPQMAASVTNYELKAITILTTCMQARKDREELTGTIYPRLDWKS